MTIQTELLAEVEAFVRDFDISETTFGIFAMNDGSFVSRLRGGRNITVRTVERVRDYIEAELAHAAES